MLLIEMKIWKGGRVGSRPNYSCNIREKKIKKFLSSGRNFNTLGKETEVRRSFLLGKRTKLGFSELEIRKTFSHENRPVNITKPQKMGSYGEKAWMG